MCLELNDLTYSLEASATRFVFYQGFNDVNLFVEDKGAEYEYESIFKRLLEDKFCIRAIFSLGGKSNVKKLYREFGNNTGGVKNYYIVDGDFDRYIDSESMIQDSCFIYLKAYNIENYFLDEYACEQFAKSRLKCLDHEVKTRVNFLDWRKKIVNQSKKLFLCYCFLQKYYPQIPTCSRSPYLFIDNTTGFEREDGAFQRYWESVLELDPSVEIKLNELAYIYESVNGEDYFNLICGKFLFCSLYSYLRAVIGHKFEKLDLRWYLLNHFDISSLFYVKTAILSDFVHKEPIAVG